VAVRAIRNLILIGTLLPMCGCFPTLYVPKLGYDRIELRLTPADPVFTGPGGSGPIFSLPAVQSGGCCESECGGCCPSSPLQPIDPFGWLRYGNQGTHEVDPVGWILGI